MGYVHDVKKLSIFYLKKLQRRFRRPASTLSLALTCAVLFLLSAALLVGILPTSTSDEELNATSSLFAPYESVSHLFVYGCQHNVMHVAMLLYSASSYSCCLTRAEATVALVYDASMHSLLQSEEHLQYFLSRGLTYLTVITSTSTAKDMEVIVDRLLSSHLTYRISLVPHVANSTFPYQYSYVAFMLARVARLNDRVLQRVHSTLHSPDCFHGPRLIFPLLNSGLASSWKIVKEAITLGIQHERCTIVGSLSRPWPYANASTCPQADLSCYFIDYPSYEVDFLQYLRSTLPQNEDQIMADWQDNDAPTWWIVWLRTRRKMSHAPAILDARPIIDDITLSYFTIGRPRAYLIRRFSDWLLHNVTLSRPYVGVHVRHGDKAREATLAPFSRYLLLVFRETARLETQWVHIATDNNTILTTEIPRYGRVLRWNYIHYERPNDDWYMTPQDSKDPERFFHNTYFEALILAHADYFIGTASSGYSRLVHALRVMLNRGDRTRLI